MIWTGLICLFVARQPNFSTMTIIAMISFAMLFIGNVNLLHLGGAGISASLLGVIYMLSAEYRRNRLLAFFDGGDSNLNEATQLNESIIAIGNGGLFGVGPGQSRQSHLFIPEAHNDFILGVIGEEYGFIGLIIILLTFSFIFYRGMKIAKKAPDNFGYFLAIGIIVTLSIYVTLNMCVNTGILPTTGVALPFISYGGTAIIFHSIAVGILLNISAQSFTYKVKD